MRTLFSDTGLRLAPDPLLKPTGTNAEPLRLRTNQLRASRTGGPVFPNADKRVPGLFRDDTHKSASAACSTAANLGLSTVLSWRFAPICSPQALSFQELYPAFLYGTAMPNALCRSAAEFYRLRVTVTVDQFIGYGRHRDRKPSPK